MSPFGPLFGGGDYYSQQMRGPHGPWMGCGCGSFLMVLVGILLVFTGCFSGCANLLFRY
jgi:hypothetical protein